MTVRTIILNNGGFSENPTEVDDSADASIYTQWFEGNQLIEGDFPLASLEKI